MSNRQYVFNLTGRIFDTKLVSLDEVTMFMVDGIIDQMLYQTWITKVKDLLFETADQVKIGDKMIIISEMNPEHFGAASLLVMAYSRVNVDPEIWFSVSADHGVYVSTQEFVAFAEEFKHTWNEQNLIDFSNLEK